MDKNPDLPYEIIDLILFYSHDKISVNLALTCKKFYNYIFLLTSKLINECFPKILIDKIHKFHNVSPIITLIYLYNTGKLRKKYYTDVLSYDLGKYQIEIYNEITLFSKSGGLIYNFNITVSIGNEKIMISEYRKQNFLINNHLLTYDKSQIRNITISEIFEILNENISYHSNGK